MKDTVVDSSVVTKWIVPEPDSDQADKVADDVAHAGCQLIVLDLALVEVTNVIWTRHHRKLDTLDEARQYLADLLQSPVRIEPAKRLLTAAFEIAAKHDRAVYDALFVALARDLKLQGVTADRPLHSAVHADYPEIVLLKDWP
jgi:predicted nucleic acid-binding protein